MKRIYFLLLLPLLIGCSHKTQTSSVDPTPSVEPSSEISESEVSSETETSESESSSEAPVQRIGRRSELREEFKDIMYAVLDRAMFTEEMFDPALHAYASNFTVSESLFLNRILAYAKEYTINYDTKRIESDKFLILRDVDNEKVIRYSLSYLEEYEFEDDGEEPETIQQTCTITFRNGGFTTSSFEKATTQSSFIEWFNSHENAAGLLGSIGYNSSTSYVQMNYVGDNDDPKRFSTYILGSKNSDGSMTFNFNYPIFSVQCTVQAYSKYIAYSDSYSIDYNSVFKLNDTERNLSVASDYTGITPEVIVTDYPARDTTKIKLSSEGGRVFVHEMVITYLVGTY